MKVFSKDGKISNYTTMGNGLDGFGDVRIIDERREEDGE